MIPTGPQISQGAAMRRDDICIHVGPANRAWLEAIMRLTGKFDPLEQIPPDVDHAS
jgi:hypothetical protein